MLKFLIQLLLALSALVGPWLVLSFEVTKNYHLQFFCFFVLVFVITNIIARHRVQGVVKPDDNADWGQNVEIAAVGGAIFLLIGQSGGFASVLLPLFFIYFFFSCFVNHVLISLILVLAEIAFFYFMTPSFGPEYYGAVLSVAIFLPIALFAQKYYAKAVKDSLELQSEREKVAYYNMYAEKKQSEVLSQQKHISGEIKNVKIFLHSLIPKIDELQKASRFSQNQLVISEGLTEIGLALRRVIRIEDNHEQQETK